MSKGAWFDVMLDDKFLGRIKIKLFDSTVPLTTRNFRAFVVGINGKQYAGTRLHRISPGGVAGGDVDRNDGTGGHSVYGATFADENLQTKHDIPGLLSMANKGYKNSNNSQFIITTCARPDLDGRNVVFGQVVEGLSVIVDVTQKYGSTSGMPIKKVVMGRAGLW